jgi:hypothetical protein
MIWMLIVIKGCVVQIDVLSQGANSQVIVCVQPLSVGSSNASRQDALTGQNALQAALLFIGT